MGRLRTGVDLPLLNVKIMPDFIVVVDLFIGTPSVLVKVPSKKKEEFISALIKQAQNLPRELYKSLTWDRDESASEIYFSNRYTGLFL
jgi:hypothetical protein